VCYISRLTQDLKFIFRVPIRNTMIKNRQDKKKRHMNFFLNLWLCPFKIEGIRGARTLYLPQNVQVILRPDLASLIVEYFLDPPLYNNDAQHGFRKNRSCESQLILSVQDLAKGNDFGEQTGLIFLQSI
jgi:hypothetical protein